VDEELLQKLGSKAINKEELFRRVEADFGLVPKLLEGTGSPKAAIRYGCGSILMDLCQKHPAKLYPYMDEFVKLLDSKHRILLWNGLGAIANLTAADTDRKFDKIFDRYYSYLGAEYMVTVANVVGNSATIVTNKPYLANRILTELLKVENLQTTPHLTDECKLVIAQHAIETFNVLVKYIQNKQALIAFAEKHQNSSRVALKIEAQKFLKKWR
jgi:hypothetical protein